MSHQAASRVLLIDIENVAKALDILGAKGFVEFDHVLICHTHLEPKIPLSSAPYFSDLLLSGKLRLVSLTNSGKNAAEFGITYWAGKLAATLPQGSHFTIFSRDQDFKHLVHLLKEDGMQVAWDPKKTEIFMEASTPLPALSQQFYETRLRKMANRPAGRKALLNSIDSFFAQSKAKGVTSLAVIEELKAQGLIHLGSHDQIIYEEQSAASLECFGKDAIPF